MSMPLEPADTTDTDVTDNAATTTDTSTDQQPPVQDAAFWESEANKWKAQSRKHEKAAEKLSKAKPAEAPPAQSPSDEIKALKAEMAREKAQDKLDAAAAKAGVDVSDILDYVAVDKFIDDGSVDIESINEFVGKFAAKNPKTEPKFAQGIGVGPQAGGSTQLGRKDLERMTPNQIVEAEKAGRFDHLLGRSK